MNYKRLFSVFALVAVVGIVYLVRSQPSEQQVPQQKVAKPANLELGGPNKIAVKLGDVAEAEVLDWGTPVDGLKLTRIALCASKDPKCERVLVTGVEQLFAPGNKVRVHSHHIFNIPTISGDAFYMALAPAD